MHMELLSAIQGMLQQSNQTVFENIEQMEQFLQPHEKCVEAVEKEQSAMAFRITKTIIELTDMRNTMELHTKQITQQFECIDKKVDSLSMEIPMKLQEVINAWWVMYD